MSLSCEVEMYGRDRECVKAVEVSPSALYTLTKTKGNMSLSLWEPDGITLAAF